MPDQDRRNATRYPAAAAGSGLARVGWWEGKHFRTAAARIEDISTGGAAVALDSEARTSTAVWISLEGPGPVEWVEARLAGVATAEDGSQVVRLAFPMSCPYEVFKAVAWGEPAPRSARPAPDPPPVAPPLAPTTDRPGLPVRPPSRVDSDPAPEGRPTYVVVSVPADALPTLSEAQRSVRTAGGRVGILPWVVAFAVALGVAGLLAALVFEKMGAIRALASPPESARY